MRRILTSLLLLASAVPGRAAGTTNATRSLTIRDCIDRALAANLDIKLQHVNLPVADWNVVQALSVFDPTLTGGARYSDTSVATDKDSLYATRQVALDAGVAGRLETGTGYSLDANLDHTAPRFLPYTGGPTATLTQPLLKNFGTEPNTALIRMARKQRGIAEQNFIQQVMGIITAVENAYYELIYTIENLKAKVEDLDRAKRLLEEDRKRVQIGTLSPLDVVQAESGVAGSVNAVIIAERVIKDNENTLKRLITQNVLEFSGESLVPVNYPKFEAVDGDLTNHLRLALEKRPDYLAAREELERRNILVKFNQNQLLPEVDLQGSVGLGGYGRTVGRFNDSIGDATYPAWGIGVAVTFPLGNRNAKANYNIAKLQSDQQVIALKILEQDIIVAVDNALRRVQSNLQSIDATEAASRLAAESLKAEETKLRAGTSTSFLVLQAQSVLAAARSAEIRARADYAESLAALAQAEGCTLQRHSIVLDKN